MSKFNMTEYMRKWREKNRERWNELSRQRTRMLKERNKEKRYENIFLSMKTNFFIKDGHKVYIHKKGNKYYYEIFFKDFREHYISQEFSSRLNLNKDLMYAI